MYDSYNNKIEKNVRQSLSAGKYNLKFQHPVYGRKDTTISLIGGENLSLTCYFQQTVNINAFSENGEEIYALIMINGKIQEDVWTPKQINLSPGIYRYSVKKRGYEPIEKEIRLEIKPTFKKITHHRTFHLRKIN